MRVESLEHRRLLNVQGVDPNPTSQAVVQGDPVSFDLDYWTDPGMAFLTGLRLRVHFDSSMLTWDSATNVLTTALVATQVLDDTLPGTNYDLDSTTDSYYLIAWADMFGGQWPGVEATRLFTSNFTTAPDVTGSTTVHLTSGTTSANWTFEGTDATITFVANTPPTSEAGGPYSVNEDGSVVLDGSASSDPNQSSASLIYEWDLDGDGLFGETGVDASRGDETDMRPTFSAAGMTSPSSVTISLRVTDSHSAVSNIDTTTVNVVEHSQIATLSATSVDEGSASTLSGTLIDPGVANASTLQVDWGDGSPVETFNYAAGETTFSETHTYLDDDPTVTPSDTYTINVALSDDGGGTDTNSTTVTVTNVVPVLSDFVFTSPFEGSASTLTMTITDPSPNDTFTIRVDWNDGLPSEVFTYPAGSTLFSESHLFTDDEPTGTPIDNYAVLMSIEDDDGGINFEAFTAEIENVAPTLANVSTTTIDEGGTTTLTAEIVDPSALDTFEVEIDWGDGSPLETFAPLAGVTTFSKDHTFLDDNPTGTASDDYPISIRVTDDDTGTSVTDATVTINNVAPTLSALTATAAALDEGGIGTITGTMADIGTLDTFSLEVDWGDGTPLQTFTYGLGITDFEETHVYLDDTPTGTPTDDITVTVTLLDDDTGSDSGTVLMTVNNIAPTLSDLAVTDANEGGTSTLSGTIADTGTLDTFFLDVDWGDGMGLETFSFAAGTTTFSETHSYLDDDPSVTPADNYTIQATLRDDDTGSDIAPTITVTITNVAPTVDVGADITVDEGSTMSTSGSFVDPGPADNWIGTVDYGDGTGPALLALNLDGTFDLDHTYADDGQFLVTVTVDDDDSGSGFDTLLVTVDNVAPTVDAGLDVTTNEGAVVNFAGSMTDPGTLDTHTFEWDFGDGSPTITGVSSPSHVYADDEVYTVTLTVTDDDGGSQSDALTVQVGNLAPEVTAGVDQVVDADVLLTLDPANFIDLGTLDTHTATIDWGDGTAAESGVVSETPFGPPGDQVGMSGTVSGSHTYTQNGAYTVTVTVLDDEGDSQSDSFTVRVGVLAQIVTPDPVLQYVLAGDPIHFDVNYSTSPADTNLTGLGLRIHFDSSMISFDTLSNVLQTSLLSEQPPELDTGDFDLDSNTDQFVLIGWAGPSEVWPGIFPARLFTAGFTSQPLTTGATTVNFTTNVTPPNWEMVSTSATIVFNEPPIAEAGGPYTVNEGETVVLDASMTTDDFPGTLIYEWDLDGDAIFGETGLGAVQGDETGVNPTFSAAGIDGPNTLTVDLRVTDAGGLVGTDTATIDVANVNPTVDVGADNSTNEGDTFTQTGTFTDPGPDTWNATVNYGDGVGPEPLALNPDMTFDLTHVYTDNGVYTVSVSVTDDDGGTHSNSLFVTVANVDPLVDAGPDITINLGDPFVEAGSFTDPGSDTWTATVDYGDGSGLQPLTLNPDRTFDFDHTYVDVGQFTVTVTVFDDDGGSGFNTLTVDTGNMVPVVDAGLDTTLDEGTSFIRSGSFLDLGADTWTATVDYGDGSGTQVLALQPDKTFALDHLYIENGNYTLTVAVFDGENEGSDTAIVTVNNVAPILSNLSATSIDEGSDSTLTGTIADQGILDTFTLRVDWGDGSAIENFIDYPAGTTGFTETHRYLDNPNGFDPGDYTISVTLFDDDAGSSATLTTLAEVSNVGPIVDASDDVPVGEGHDIAISGLFTDPGADTWTGTVDFGDGSGPVPLDLNLDKTFVLNHVYPGEGQFDVYVTVEDDDGVQGSDLFTISIVPVAPVVDLGPDITINENDTFSTTGSFLDLGDDSWTATVDYHDGSGPIPLALNPDQTFDLSNHYSDDGVHVVTVTVTDTSDMLEGTDSLTLTVANVNPTVDAGADATISEGSLFVGSASFTDPGADTWTATIDYGDGTALETLDLNLTQSIALNHIYNDDGSYPVKITVTDDDGGVGTDTRTVTVTNVAPTLDVGANASSDEGSTFVRLISLTDPGTDSWTVTIDYNDGTALETTDLYSFKTFSLNHVFRDNGLYNVNVTITDDDGGSQSDTFSIDVANVNPSVSLGSDIWLPLFSPFSSTGSFIDPGEDSWTVTVNYGDGSPDGSLVVNPDGTFEMNHSFASPGDYSVTVTVDDDDGGTGVDTLIVTVGNVAPTADAGGPYHLNEGRKVRLDASGSYDPANDIATYEWDLDGDGIFESSEISTLFSGADDGVFPVSLRVTDESGLVGTDQTTVTVHNVAPTVRVGPDMIAGATQPTELIGWFTDPGSLDTHTFTWDFGDGSPVETELLRPTHVYAANGYYTATLTVTDDDGGSNFETVLVTVGDFPDPTDVLELGTVDYREVSDLDPNGAGQWLGFRSYRDGILSIVPSTDLVTLTLYDANFQELPFSIAPDGRIDAPVDSLHQEFHLLVTGSTPSVDLRVVNLARNVGPVLEIFGTADDDQFEYDASPPRLITVKGVDYLFNDTDTETVTFYGMTGDDTLVLHDSPGDDLLQAWVKQVSFSGPDFELEAVGFESIIADGNAGGTNSAQLYDSSGDDTFVNEPGLAQFWGDHFSYHVSSFQKVIAVSKFGGNDSGNLYAPAGDHHFVGTMDSARLTGADVNVRAMFFESLVVQASDGFNTASLSGSPETDWFVGKPGHATLSRPGYSTTVLDFDNVLAQAISGGDDWAQLYDSPGDDWFDASPFDATLTGDGFQIAARGFIGTHGYAKAGGHDKAYLHDSDGDDIFKATPIYGRLSGENYTSRAKFFEELNVYAENGGNDKAYFKSDSLDDIFDSTDISTQLISAEYIQQAKFFDFIYAKQDDVGMQLYPVLDPILLLDDGSI